MCKKAVYLSILFGTILSTPFVMAQETTGRILGVVQDSTGGVLPGTEVEIDDPAMIQIPRQPARGNDRTGGGAVQERSLYI